jgi:hypothetical protein
VFVNSASGVAGGPRNWSNSLLDPYTQEWQDLNNLVTQDVNNFIIIF